jgi:glycosyltransferase involved in cell wall biosynthesis
MALRLMMTADAVGGVWTYALDLARGVAAAGGHTDLVVLGPAPSPDQVREALGVDALRVLDTGWPLDWTAQTPAEIDAAAAAVRALADEIRPDLVHLNSPTLAKAGRFQTPVLGACHSCLASWWAAVKQGPPPADFGWRTEALRQGMAGCDALVAPSRSFARTTAAAHGVAEPLVIYNGRRSPAPGGDGHETFVFTSGRLWDQGKNLATLEAAATLSSLPIHAAGPMDGPGGESFRPARLRALGRLSADEHARWLRRTPIYASSALYEPFGLGVLEAAQAGCPLVLSNLASFRELWDGAALFIDPRRPEAFAAAFAELAADAPRRRALGQAARARASRFTVAAMTCGMLDLYERLGAMVRPGAAA